MENKEIWKDIIGYETYYQISNLGRVKSLAKHSNGLSKNQYTDKEIILKPTISSTGYFVVSLYINNKKIQHYIHRLIASHFIPNIDNKPEVNHINSIRHDNRLENLEWCTHKENIQHAVDTGQLKPKKGENHGGSKLTEIQVLEIKERLNNQENGVNIAKLFSVSHKTISKIKTGKRWNHI